MKLNEFIRNIPVWTSHDEQQILESIKEPVPMASFTEREQTIIESLVRKSLLIKINGQNSVYVYPNI